MNKHTKKDLQKQRHEEIPLDLNKLRWQVRNIQKQKRER